MLRNAGIVSRRIFTDPPDNASDTPSSPMQVGARTTAPSCDFPLCPGATGAETPSRAIEALLGNDARRQDRSAGLILSSKSIARAVLAGVFTNENIALVFLERLNSDFVVNCTDSVAAGTRSRCARSSASQKSDRPLWGLQPALLELRRAQTGTPRI